MSDEKDRHKGLQNSFSKNMDEMSKLLFNPDKEALHKSQSEERKSHIVDKKIELIKENVNGTKKYSQCANKPRIQVIDYTNKPLVECLSKVDMKAYVNNDIIDSSSKFKCKKSSSLEYLDDNKLDLMNKTVLKERIAPKKRVVINCSGVRFEVYKETLNLISESRLANLTETNSDYDSIRDEYFFDRDPKSFYAILNYYRTGKLHPPLDVCGNLFYEELNFWGIRETCIQPCCWTSYSTKRECDNILRQVVDENEEQDGMLNDLLFFISKHFYINI
jgi:hypothetical protein